MDSHSKVPGSRNFMYFPVDTEDSEKKQEQSEDDRELARDVLDKLLKAIGREALKEKTPSLQELEQILLESMLSVSQDSRESQRSTTRSEKDGKGGEDSGMPLVRQLMQKGYLKDSPKWLSA